MTRINLVPPSELTDQHLFAEFREIKMIPKALSRSLRARGLTGVIKSIPSQFTLNTGHVMFFYDKGKYLANRFEELKTELRLRGVMLNEGSLFDEDEAFINNPRLCGDYEPTKDALGIIRSRIADKIAMKPEWYRYCGKPLHFMVSVV